MRISRALLFLAPFTLLSSGASAQVLITEIVSNGATPQVELDEWIEVQNTGTATAIIDGWRLHDFVAATESATGWAFPAGTMLAPGQVIVVTRQSMAFNLIVGLTPSFELAETIDDPNVPNLMPVGGTDVITLANGGTGDAVVLRDDTGTLVSGVEWGTTDRSVPGAPFTAVPAEDESLTRVDTTGNSADDFIVSNNPTPFVGFTSSQTLIVGTAATPRHAVFGREFTVSTNVTDADGINFVEIYFASATSSAGAAAGIYQPATMTSSGATYSFSDQVADLAGGEPEDFHSRYLRFYISVEDNNNDVATDPVEAVQSADNENYLPVYVQNVVPGGTTTIAAAREESAEDTPRWTDHSVRVQGIALVENGILDPDRTLFTIQDDSMAAITVFSATTAPDFTVGDELIVLGTIGTFRGATQLNDPEIEVTGNSVANVPESTLTLAQILSDGEQYEGELVRVADVDFVSPQTNWPSDPDNLGSWNVDITDGQGNEITLRVTSGTDIFGQPAPQYGFDVRGILNERDNVWQLFPRSSEDISAKPMPPMPDAGMMMGMDATTGQDTGIKPDSGTGGQPDSGTGTNPDDEGCNCSASPQHSSSGAFGLILLALCAFIRRRK